MTQSETTLIESWEVVESHPVVLKDIVCKETRWDCWEQRQGRKIMLETVQHLRLLLGWDRDHCRFKWIQKPQWSAGWLSSSDLILIWRRWRRKLKRKFAEFVSVERKKQKRWMAKASQSSSILWFQHANALVRPNTSTWSVYNNGLVALKLTILSKTVWQRSTKSLPVSFARPNIQTR